MIFIHNTAVGRRISAQCVNVRLREVLLSENQVLRIMGSPDGLENSITEVLRTRGGVGVFSEQAKSEKLELS